MERKHHGLSTANRQFRGNNSIHTLQIIMQSRYKKIEVHNIQIYSKYTTSICISIIAFSRSTLSFFFLLFSCGLLPGNGLIGSQICCCHVPPLTRGITSFLLIQSKNHKAQTWLCQQWLYNNNNNHVS